ncbi:exported hypothetical protein [Gammaproteobacteria bacterium]
MNKRIIFGFFSLAVLFSVFLAEVAVAVPDNSGYKYGVFFCTRDLSSELYKQIEKGKIASSIFLGTTSSSAIASSLMTSLTFKVVLPSSVILGAGIAYLSTDFVHDWYKKGIYEKATESLASISSISTSSLQGNYLKVNDTAVDGDNTYRHCSILSAQYVDDKDGYIRLKGFDTKGFFQNEKQLYPSHEQDTAVDRNDQIDSSTVCTLVKQAENKREYVKLTNIISEFFAFETDKGYSVTEHNCCTVAYNAVKKINGNTDVIDRSNFNHGIGMPSNSWFSFLADSIEEKQEKKDSEDL